MGTRTSTGADRIASLDGLRALSIVFVLVAHAAGTRGFPISEGTGDALGLGELGVHVFFVISGYLITRLLLDELARTDRISLGRFYLRRTLRIFPPYYALLGALVAAQALGWIELAPHDAARALTYTSNYDAGRSWFIGHTWSLSVEEQFYLLWPAVVILAGSRRALAVAAAVVFLGPAIRVGEWEWMRWASDGIGQRFETVADTVAVGCVLAGVQQRLHGFTPYRRWLESPLFALVPLTVVAANLLHDHPLVYFGAGLTLVNVGAALCIDWSVTFSQGRIGRVLNAGPVAFVGVMSYSLYLWQQPFLNRASSALPSSFPLNVVLLGVASLASFYLVERPSLRLRRRLEGVLVRHRTSLPRGADADVRAAAISSESRA